MELRSHPVIWRLHMLAGFLELPPSGFRTFLWKELRFAAFGDRQHFKETI